MDSIQSVSSQMMVHALLQQKYCFRHANIVLSTTAISKFSESYGTYENKLSNNYRWLSPRQKRRQT